jgi:hypothetical protein
MAIRLITTPAATIAVSGSISSILAESAGDVKQFGRTSWLSQGSPFAGGRRLAAAVEGIDRPGISPPVVCEVIYLHERNNTVSKNTDETAIEAADGMSTDGLTPAVLASVGSVALALYFYYVRGDKQRGQFVGFWPVTILGLASYFKLEEIQKTLEESDE